MTSGEFSHKYPHLTTLEAKIECGRHARIALVIDGSPESSKDQAVICGLATLVDFSKVKPGNFFVQLRPTTLKEIGRLARMRPESIGVILERLQTQYRIYLRRGPQRNYKSRTIIQVGIGPQLTLFAPRLTPEHLFNMTSRALFDATRNGDNREQIRCMILRAEEHLGRFNNQDEKRRLWKQIQRTREKYLTK